METTKVKLTLIIEKRANKVIIAEAKKDFVDFLFNLLSLPISTVIRLLKNGSTLGCVDNLYQSLENLNDAYLQPNQNKDDLLKRHVTAALNAPPLLPEARISTCNCKKPSAGEGGVVKNLVTYMVSDDLSVTPVSMTSGIELLQHNVKDIGVLEKRVVELGIDEGLELLKNSLKSKTALTNVFLMKTELKDVAISNFA
ncbi:hypothetical protein KPL70_011036 [Citrus sinensis]|uniref:DUF674 domain-containing protein n=2 Tax=Citrus TaxID=2706 RepID=V4THW6_CITCL|nr:hypothetical protein CICLE_v10033359mg [Citrus x clementina]KAH9703204.1 hypothetical protein KPL70_011036 [Citrus sinensis]